MYILYSIPRDGGLAVFTGPFESEDQARNFARRALDDEAEFQIAPMESPARYV